MSLVLSKRTTSRTLVCQKLVLICFYYSRCFGTVTYCISHRNLCTPPNGIAYEHKFWMWLTIGLRSLCCVVFYYISFILWSKGDIFSHLLSVIYLTTVVFCTLSTLITQIWCNKRSIIAINNFLEVINCVRQLDPNYEIFQTSHLALLAVKIMCIIYEIGGIVYSVFEATTLSEVATNMGNSYLFVGVWLNLHIACLLYVFIDALFGAFNHYISSSFLAKLREAQEFTNNSLPPYKVKELVLDLEKISQIYYDILRVGQELHSLLQFSVANTILFNYSGAIAVVYFMIWTYFEKDIVLWHYVVFILKLTVDIAVLSLAAHKAIKSSHVIRRIGLDNVILPENKNWHRNIELFLYHINLYDFKLNILGFFDITNALTLTFIAGILTSFTIFLPFLIKSFKMKEILTAN